MEGLVWIAGSLWLRMGLGIFWLVGLWVYLVMLVWWILILMVAWLLVSQRGLMEGW